MVVSSSMLAATVGEPYHIKFGGVAQFQLASDVAQQFIEAVDHPHQGARVFNLGGEPISMEAVVSAIQAVVPGAAITHDPKPLPFPAGFEDRSLREALPYVNHTPIEEGVRRTMEHFKHCLANGLLQYTD